MEYIRKKKYFIVILIFASLFSCSKDEEVLTTEMIQTKLVGNWTGSGSADFGGGTDWTAVFDISFGGHYSGHITSVQNGTITSVFDNGDDNLTHPDKRIIIKSIDALSNAHGTVKFVHSDGSILEYEIKDLVFSNNDKDLDFVVSWGAEMSYSLTRN